MSEGVAGAAYVWTSGVVAVVFVTLAVLACARARSHGRPGWWAAAMFGALAAYLIVAVLALALDGTPPTWLARVVVSILLLFPFLVLMFAASFGEIRRRFAVGAAVITVAILLPVFVLPADGSEPPWLSVYLFAMLGYWTTFSFAASTLLWRAGRAQPTVARRRMRLMSLATIILALALLLSGLTGLSEAALNVVKVGVVGLLLVCGLTFMLGFQPPKMFILAWRQPAEELLGQAMLAVLRADTAQDIAAELLPRVTQTVGSAGAALAGEDFRVFATYGSAPGVGTLLEDVDAPQGSSPMRQAVPLGEHRGHLIVWTSAYAPFFGRHELALLDRIGAFASLALERSELLATERVRAAALQEAKREAEQARDAADLANTAKSEFLSRMSHEFRTPLNAVIGFSQLLQTASLTPDDQEAVGHVFKAGRHLLALVNDILDLSRIEAGEMTISMEPVHAGELVEDAVALIRPLADERSIELSLPESGANEYLLADRQRCRQILLNLLSNAVKYNHDGGQVQVMCKRVGPMLRISIRDTGAGIDAKLQRRLFEPFDRLGADATGIEGTGLGLALSQQLGKVMGGHVGVESEPGVGSTFWVDMPTTGPPTHVVRPTGSPEHEAPQRRKRTLLLVEDNLTNLRLVEAMLRGNPEISILPAMQGMLAIDLAYQHRPDVVVLDLHLPDIDGHEVLQRLKSDPRTRHIPVIVATADASSGRERQLRRDGAFEYVAKPLDVHRFLDVVNAALAHSDADDAADQASSPTPKRRPRKNKES